jgi:hypothetical protein
VQVVSSSSRGCPSIRSNHVNIANIEDAEKLRSLAETTECTNKTELGALQIDKMDGLVSKLSLYVTCIEISDSESDKNNEPEKERHTINCEVFNPWMDMLELLSVSNDSLGNENQTDRDNSQPTQDISSEWESKWDDNQVDSYGSPVTTMFLSSSIERPYDISHNHLFYARKPSRPTCNPGLDGKFYKVCKNDTIAISPRSPVYKILRKEHLERGLIK